MPSVFTHSAFYVVWVFAELDVYSLNNYQLVPIVTQLNYLLLVYDLIIKLSIE